MTIHWKAVEQYFAVGIFGLNYTQFVILENLSIFDLALSGVKGVINNTREGHFIMFFKDVCIISACYYWTDFYFESTPDHVKKIPFV